MAFFVDRFRNIETKEYEVEVVTPLFLGGADPKTAELRIPSIKGALRFWWRALYGSSNIEEMKKQEDSVFGSTDCKSEISIQLSKEENVKSVRKNLSGGTTFQVKNFSLGIIDYLAFGIRENRSGYNRDHIEPGNNFSIKIRSKSGVAEQIFNAFEHLINYGGLGAKSRNGFGSLCIKNSPGHTLSCSDEIRDFASLSNKTKLFNSFAEHDSWIKALSEVGLVYRAARISISTSKRLLIAKPIVQLNNYERHSKPYFLHVNKLSNGKYQGQILFMPYRYYDSKKHDEYLAVCEAMNRKIEELCGGNK